MSNVIGQVFSVSKVDEPKDEVIKIRAFTALEAVRIWAVIYDDGDSEGFISGGGKLVAHVVSESGAISNYIITGRQLPEFELVSAF